jgi:hypothetical protein
MPRNVKVATTQMEISRDPAKNLVCVHALLLLLLRAMVRASQPLVHQKQQGC